MLDISHDRLNFQYSLFRMHLIDQKPNYYKKLINDFSLKVQLH